MGGTQSGWSAGAAHRERSSDTGNPRSPDFGGLDPYTEHMADSSGLMRTPAFDRHVASLQKDIVDPVLMEPYLMLDCARSCTDEMGESMRSMVRKAARLAVYELIMMRVKNHHIPATIRVDIALQ